MKNKTMATEIIFDLLKELKQSRERLMEISVNAREEVTRLDKIIEEVGNE